MTEPTRMPTDPADALAIEASLELAGERDGDLTEAVYAILFAEQPEMQALFWRDGNGLIKGEMLMRVIEAILDFISERRYALSCEVVTHEGYDVPRQVFATFFGVVMRAVRSACGETWTLAMDDAWRRLLADLDRYVRQPAAAAA
jgi:hemoglobin-like flavoprotein